MKPNDRVAKIDALAPTFFRSQLAGCDETVQFILALDHSDPILRLRAIVCRAYHRAAEVAERLAERHDDAQSARKLLARVMARVDLEKLLELRLRAPREDLDLMDQARSEIEARGIASYLQVQQALDLLDRWQWLSFAQVKDRRADADLRNIEFLREVVSGLQYVGQTVANSGQTPDDARFFFTLRMAEIGALVGRVEPVFSVSTKGEREDRNKRDENQWLTMLKAAFELTGLSHSNLDGLLRRVGGLGRRLEDEHGSDLRGALRKLRLDFDGTERLKIFPHGNLPSTGFRVDLKLGDEVPGY